MRHVLESCGEVMVHISHAPASVGAPTRTDAFLCRLDPFGRAWCRRVSAGTDNCGSAGCVPDDVTAISCSTLIRRRRAQGAPGASGRRIGLSRCGGHGARRLIGKRALEQVRSLLFRAAVLPVGDLLEGAEDLSWQDDDQAFTVQ